ncbi:MAG: polyphenol oxidase family protein [Endomicrobia bacterium]|nr:polyphenol oxidase family protein [Endomicrobiia bacterium]
MLYKKTHKFNLFTTLKSFYNHNVEQKENKIKINNFSAEKIYSLISFIQIIKKYTNKNKIILCEQIHGNRVVFIRNEYNFGKYYMFNDIERGNYYFYFLPGADGVISANNEYILICFTADCIPLFIFSNKYDVFGIIHVGRKGLEDGVIENTLKLIKSKGLELDKFCFGVGPHICRKCYKVDGKLYDMLTKLKEKLILYSIKEVNILTSNYCTYHNNSLFYSYRKENTQKRNISAIFAK